ncbi:hypothetical protein Syun_020309 [Stephania yunnanensis]|uniref:Uncharacterized protein n=1 Tax=Stephania yunnanensis TaxID=152371 RepID=A0AAP0NN18_9MAGN
MVCKVVEESMKKEQQQQQQQKGRNHNHHHLKQMQCNKGKACKFKKSCFHGEEDGASSAILLIACIACISSTR